MWCSIKRVTKLAVAKVSYPSRIPAIILFWIFHQIIKIYHIFPNDSRSYLYLPYSATCDPIIFQLVCEKKEDIRVFSREWKTALVRQTPFTSTVDPSQKLVVRWKIGLVPFYPRNSVDDGFIKSRKRLQQQRRKIPLPAHWIVWTRCLDELVSCFCNNSENTQSRYNLKYSSKFGWLKRGFQP